MTENEELVDKAMEILKELDGKYSIIEILTILHIATSLYLGSSIKKSMNGEGNEYGGFYR